MNNPSLNLNSAEWKKQREKDWPIFERRIMGWLRFDEDREPARYLDVAKRYFMGEEIPLKPNVGQDLYGLSWPERIYLHPNLNKDTIRSVIEEHISKGFELPTFMYWGFPQSKFAGFIERKVLNEDVVDHFMEALYGNSFEEALKLRRVKFEDHAVKIMSDLTSSINGWICNGCKDRFDIKPIDRMLILFYGAIGKAEDRHINEDTYYFKKLFKTLRVFETRDSSHVEAAQKVVHNLRRTLKANRDTYCPALQKYIDSFEFEE